MTNADLHARCVAMPLPVSLNQPNRSGSRAGLTTSGEFSAHNTLASGSTVVAVRLPSPGNTIGYSENMSLTAPTPFASGMSEEDELSSLPN